MLKDKNEKKTNLIKNIGKKNLSQPKLTRINLLPEI
jgi:hypothetical protein